MSIVHFPRNCHKIRHRVGLISRSLISFSIILVFSFFCCCYCGLLIQKFCVKAEHLKAARASDDALHNKFLGHAHCLSLQIGQRFEGPA